MIRISCRGISRVHWRAVFAGEPPVVSSGTLRSAVCAARNARTAARTISSDNVNMDRWKHRSNKATQEPEDNSLPYGWEKIEDPEYGTYYLDHINKCTQYERPLPHDPNLHIQSTANPKGDQLALGAPIQRRRAYSIASTVSLGGLRFDSNPGSHFKDFTNDKLPIIKDRGTLRGTFLRSRLLKGPLGLGFTIVGGDRPEELLQIKGLIPESAAAAEGLIETGDVIVQIDDHVVLGYTHVEVVELLKSIPIGHHVRLELCRGYPLLDDCDDPNTKLIKSVAISNQSMEENGHWSSESSLSERSLKTGSQQALLSHVELMTIRALKGASGFGFTIADGPKGQYVRGVTDRQRCPGLCVGDILLELDREPLGDLSHAQVVHLLKGFSVGAQVTLLIRRTDFDFQNIPQMRRSYARQSSNGSDNSMYSSQSAPARVMQRAQTPPHAPTTVQQMKPVLLRISPQPWLHQLRQSKRSPTAASEPQCYEVELQAQENGFGLHLLGGNEQGEPVMLGSLVKGGAAEQDGRLQPGDELIMVDGRNVQQWRHEAVLSCMQEAACAGSVRITVQRRDIQSENTSSLTSLQQSLETPMIGQSSSEKNSASSSPRRTSSVVRFISPNSPPGRHLSSAVRHATFSNAQTPPSKPGNASFDPRIISSSHRIASPTPQRRSPDHIPSQSLQRVSPCRGVYSPSPCPSDKDPQTFPNSVVAPHTVQLTREEHEGFGFVLVSSQQQTDKDEVQQVYWIDRLVEGSPAARCGDLHLGDRILSINGKCVDQVDHKQLVELITTRGVYISLCVLPRNFQNEERHASLSTPEPRNIPSCNMERREWTVRKAGCAQNTIMVEIIRNINGFGLKLGGGREENTPLNITSLAPNSPAANTGRITVGDELLGINDVSTENMTYTKAIALIKNTETTLRLLLSPNAHGPGTDYHNGEEQKDAVFQQNPNLTLPAVDSRLIRALARTDSHAVTANSEQGPLQTRLWDGDAIDREIRQSMQTKEIISVSSHESQTMKLMMAASSQSRQTPSWRDWKKPGCPSIQHVMDRYNRSRTSSGTFLHARERGSWKPDTALGSYTGCEQGVRSQGRCDGFVEPRKDIYVRSYSVNPQRMEWMRSDDGLSYQAFVRSHFKPGPLQHGTQTNPAFSAGPHQMPPADSLGSPFGKPPYR
uniref:membrane-associated guanylate kinase, WW and PDZ domain-containing protein 1-like isoform X2 n=1 Tax=Myxine glutinosa TaxID=7769 RepID=UPI00358F6312